MSFVHLHSHTEYSLLDGKSSVEGLVEEACRLGQPGVAITDHGTLGGSYALWKSATANGIKPILGCEFYVAPGHRSERVPIYFGDTIQKSSDIGGQGAYTHLTVVALDDRGYRNLTRLQYEGYNSGFYRKPRIDRGLLSDHHQGLCVLSGCAGSELSTRLRLGHTREATELAHFYKDVFGDRFYIEVMSHGIENDELSDSQLNWDLLNLATEVGVPVVATNDNHYTRAEDRPAHDALLCLQTGSVLGDSSRFGHGFSGDGYHLRSRGEMEEIFPLLHGALDRSMEIYERVGSYDEVFNHSLRLPRHSSFPHENIELRLRCKNDELNWVYPDRIEYELETITSLGYAGYFLVLADIITTAKSRGIRIGPGRGSAAGSIVAYILGITEINPVPYGLLFERFLNPERISLPDIDVDIDDSRRDEFLAITRELCGEDNVVQIGTYGTCKAKKSIADATRVLGAPYPLGEKLKQKLPPDRFGFSAPLDSVDWSWVTQEPGASIIKLAQQLEGTIRNKGVHAAGVIISPQPITDLIPTYRPRGDGNLVSEFDMDEVDYLGFIKMDFLGLRNLGVIDGCLQLLPETSLPTTFDDPKVFELLQTGQTVGIFQMDGSGMRGLLRSIHPTSFADIAAVLALYRPGPMGVNAHREYADRKNHRKRVHPIHPEMEKASREILGETYGLIVYQEQVLRLLAEVAGYTYGSAENIFNAMRKKKIDKMEAERPELVRRMEGQGFSTDCINTFWDTLVPFADYSFNKSHSVGYGVISYWTAYLKAHHPVEYMAALLTKETDPDKTIEYISETQRMGVKIGHPDINTTGVGWTVSDGGIRFGFSSIRGIGANSTKILLKGRPYRNLDQFFATADSRVLNASTLKPLISSGSMDSLCGDRGKLLLESETIVSRAIRDRESKGRGQQPLYTLPYVPRSRTTLPDERGALELESLGVILTQPRVTLKANRWLSPEEWEFVATVTRAHPGYRPVDVILGETTLRGVATVSVDSEWRIAIESIDLEIEE